jgi:hypothetical protein
LAALAIVLIQPAGSAATNATDGRMSATDAGVKDVGATGALPDRSSPDPDAPRVVAFGWKDPIAT